MSDTLVLGQDLGFSTSPFFDKAVQAREGWVVAVGGRDLRRRKPEARVVDHGDALISAES